MGDEIADKGTTSQGDAATAAKSTEQPSLDVGGLTERIRQLEERLATVSPDTIVDQVVKHPRFTQQHRDMTDARVNARAQELYEMLSEPIEELAAEGVDPKLVQAQRRRAKEKARQAAEAELKPAEAETTSQSGYSPQQEALDILAANGLGWGDFPEWQGKSVSIQEIRRKVPQRAAEKTFAKLEEDRKKAWMKEYEDKAKKAQGDLGAVKPPPAGSPPNDNPIKDINDPAELYRLAREQMETGKGTK